MSQLEDFGKHVQQDPELQERLKEAESEDELVERTLAAAKQRGYDLDAEAVRQKLATSRKNVELSDADLAATSGGLPVGGTLGQSQGTLSCLTCIWPC